jgi:hypothetical protein
VRRTKEQLASASHNPLRATSRVVRGLLQQASWPRYVSLPRYVFNGRWSRVDPRTDGVRCPLMGNVVPLLPVVQSLGRIFSRSAPSAPPQIRNLDIGGPFRTRTQRLGREEDTQRCLRTVGRITSSLSRLPSLLGSPITWSHLHTGLSWVCEYGLQPTIRTNDTRPHLALGYSGSMGVRPSSAPRTAYLPGSSQVSQLGVVTLFRPDTDFAPMSAWGTRSKIVSRH